MHEMSLMASVFEIAEKEIRKIPVRRVLSVKLQVGELANALEDALQLAFEAFSRDTVFEGARLEIEKVPALWRCCLCSREFSAGVGMLFCPYCHNTDIELVRGKDLVLQSLEVE